MADVLWHVGSFFRPHRTPLYTSIPSILGIHRWTYGMAGALEVGCGWTQPSFFLHKHVGTWGHLSHYYPSVSPKGDLEEWYGPKVR